MKFRISQSYYLISTFLLVFMTVWGYFVAQNNEFLRRTLEENQPLFQFLQTLSPVWLFIAIFINNAIKTLAVILLGFIFGVVPLYFTYANGLLLGIVLALSENQGRLSAAMAGLLPHGVFEFPALVLSVGYSLWLGMQFILKIRNGEPFLPKLRFALKRYWQVIIPLLLVAAAIETFITPILLASFL